MGGLGNESCRWEQVFGPENPKEASAAPWRVDGNRWTEARSSAGIKTHQIKAEEEREREPGSAYGTPPGRGDRALRPAVSLCLGRLEASALLDSIGRL